MGYEDIRYRNRYVGYAECEYVIFFGAGMWERIYKVACKSFLNPESIWVEYTF